MSDDFEIPSPAPLTPLQRIKSYGWLILIVLTIIWGIRVQFFNKDASESLNLDLFTCPFDGSTTIIPQPKNSLYGLVYTCAQCNELVYFLPKNESGTYVTFSSLLDPETPVLGRPLELWERIVRDYTYHSDDDLIGFPRDRWQSPNTTYSSHEGDCEDTSILLINQLINAGYDARVIVGQALMGHRWGGHAWVGYKDAQGQTWVLETAQSPMPDGSIYRQPIPFSSSQSRFRPEFLLGADGIYVTERPATEPYFSPNWHRTGR
jgi:hypothetical protein